MRDERKRFAEQWMQRQSAASLRIGDDRHVDLAPFEPVKKLRGECFALRNSILSWASIQRFKQTWQQDPGKRWRGTEHDGAARAAPVLRESLPRPCDVGKDPLRGFVEHDAGGSQSYSARQSLKQLCAELGLEFTQLSGQCRLRNRIAAAAAVKLPASAIAMKLARVRRFMNGLFANIDI